LRWLSVSTAIPPAAIICIIREVPDLGIPETIVIILALADSLPTESCLVARSHPSFFGESFPLAVFAATNIKLKIQRAPNGARDEKIRKKKSDSYWGAVADSSEIFSPTAQLRRLSHYTTI
jgi:hypothetical protein